MNNEFLVLSVGYKKFLDYVHGSLSQERRQVNRMLRSTFFWSFLGPAAIFALGVILINFGILPKRAKKILDLFFLIFPVGFAAYFTIRELYQEMPHFFRKGGIFLSLRQSGKNGEWRLKVCDELRTQLGTDPKLWKWIATNFATDLELIRARSRYMSILSGAVFFVLIEGFGSFSVVEEESGRQQFLAWFDGMTTEVGQLAAISLFLVLMYLSGLQNHQLLARFQFCAELISQDNSEKNSKP